MKINRTKLQQMMQNNEVFQEIDSDLQQQLVYAIDSHSYNLDLVLETKVADNFLKYLIRVRQLPIEPFMHDLLNYLKLIATLNKRKEIMPVDLYMLFKVDIQVENWMKMVRNSLGKAIFREYYLYLDQNGSFKDQLTVDFYNRTVNEHQIELAEQILKWLDENIDTLEKLEANDRQNQNLKNRFFQDEIYDFYETQLERILQIMKFQQRAFKLIETY